MSIDLVELDEDAVRQIQALQNELENRYVEIYSPNPPPEASRVFIDTHIQRTLSQLRAGYLRCYQVLDDDPQRQWFKDISDSLPNFAETFVTKSPLVSAGRTLTSIKSIVGFPGIALFVAVSGAASYVSALFWSCYCHALVIAIYLLPFVLWYSLSHGFLLKRNTFFAKRRPHETALVSRGPYDIYDLEGELLGYLSQDPGPELQWDVISYALIAFLVGIVGPILLNGHAKRWAILDFQLEGLVFLLVFLVSLVNSLRRQGGWRPRGAPRIHHSSS